MSSENGRAAFHKQAVIGLGEFDRIHFRVLFYSVVREEDSHDRAAATTKTTTIKDNAKIVKSKPNQTKRCCMTPSPSVSLPLSLSLFPPVPLTRDACSLVSAKSTNNKKVVVWKPFPFSLLPSPLSPISYLQGQNQNLKEDKARKDKRRDVHTLFVLPLLFCCSAAWHFFIYCWRDSACSSLAKRSVSVGQVFFYNVSQTSNAK